MVDDSTPIFVRIADQVADDIASGALSEGDRVPSSNEFAAFHRINPATAAKGITLLVDRGLVEKRRGIGMFVATGAQNALLAQRRSDFANRYVVPLIAEAQRLRITSDTLVAMVAEASVAPSEPTHQIGQQV